MLLDHAQKLYTFAVNATGGQRTYQTSVPAVASSYSSSSYGDDLALAALFLAKAMNSASIYKEAEGYFNKYRLKGQDGVFNWDSVTPGVVVLFAQINQASADFGGNVSAWQQEAENYFDRIVNKQSQGHLTNGQLPPFFPCKSVSSYRCIGGLLFYPGDSDDASLNPALSAAMLFARYAQIASTSAKKTSYLV
jgi:endoglucanase